jgi:hypothetical protein
MPKATVTTDTQHFELKSLEGAYVDVRALSYGEKKAREDIASRMYAESLERNGTRPENNRLFIDTMARQSVLYDFQRCIIDHNLEDDRGNKLNFNNDGTLDILDPRVGSELEKILSMLNGDDADLEDFRKGLGESSEKSASSETLVQSQTPPTTK